MVAFRAAALFAATAALMVMAITPVATTAAAVPSLLHGGVSHISFKTVDIGHKCSIFTGCAKRGVCEHGSCKKTARPDEKCGATAVCLIGLTCEHGTRKGGQAEGEECSSKGFAGTKVCTGRGMCKTTTTLCKAGLVCEHGTCKHD